MDMYGMHSFSNEYIRHRQQFHDTCHTVFLINLKFLSLQIHRYRNSDFPHFRPSTDQEDGNIVN
jgi:hypothetical protein